MMSGMRDSIGDSGLNQRNLNTRFAQLVQIRFRNLLVGNYAVNVGNGNNRSQTPPAELAGIADGDDPAGHADHHAIELGLQQIGGGDAGVSIEAINAQEDDIGFQVM